MQGYLTGRGEMNENSDGSNDPVFRFFLSANQEINLTMSLYPLRVT